jgi:ABC-type phosphate transport system permease subunit
LETKIALALLILALMIIPAVARVRHILDRKNRRD